MFFLIKASIFGFHKNDNSRKSLMTHIGEQEKKKKFEQFFILTFPKVKAFAWKILRSEEDAEDIAQDIFCQTVG